MGNKQSELDSDDRDNRDDDDDNDDNDDDDDYNLFNRLRSPFPRGGKRDDTFGVTKRKFTVLEEKLLSILLNSSNDIEALSTFLHENVNFDLNNKCK